MPCGGKVSMDLWGQVNGSKYLTEAKLNSWRIIDDQSSSTTRKFVDTSEEHDLLEGLIEQSKPKVKYYNDEKYFKNLHYLLSTPFRYPPLKWGSRFGTRQERSLLYSSLDLSTAMSEKAFYRLAFLQASEGNLGGKTVSFTAFKIYVSSNKYIDLCEKPFDSFDEHISSKTNYEASQALGSQMRDNDVECFQYKSARSLDNGLNVGVFSPKALRNNKNLERTFEHLNCYSTKNSVEFSFKNRKDKPTYIFLAEKFLINGSIPLPVD